MGMCPPQGVDPSVQVPGHGALLTGGLRVEVRQHHLAVPHLVQNPVRRLEGAVQIGVQVHPAQQVEHSDADPLRPLKHPPAPAGDPPGVVGRPQHPALLVHEVGDLQAVPGMVAQGNPQGLFGRNAHPGGVFPVHHGEVDFLLLPQLPQPAPQNVLAPFADHVAYRQYIQKHTRRPPVIPGFQLSIIQYYRGKRNRK